MHDLTAKRTLVKSPPELWSELSEVERLARHLGAFGEITITKLEPEHTVAWEGESASGTVSIEPSGWGTKVTLTAQLEGEARAAEEAAVEEFLGEATASSTVAAEELASGEALTGETAAADDVVAAEPVGEEPVAEETSTEPVQDEAPAEVTAERPEMAVTAADPIQGRRRRKRGFLAWLFRSRSSAQVAGWPAAADRTEQNVQSAVDGALKAEPVAQIEPEPATEPGPAAEVEPAANHEPEPEPTVESEQAAEVETEPDVERSTVEPAAERSTLEPDVERSTVEPVAECRVCPPEADKVDSRSGGGAGVTAAGPAGSGGASGEPALDPEHAQAVLDEVLDTLGSAHHRPFSRG
jgi:hypothetical protein